MRTRQQITAKELAVYIIRYVPKDTLVSVAPSMLNEDEPPETDEFIRSDEAMKVVAVEYSPSEGLIIGWEE